MSPQNIPELVAENNRIKMLLAAKEGECEVLKARVEALQDKADAAALAIAAGKELLADSERLKAKLAGAMEFFKAYEMKSTDRLEDELANKDLMRELGLECIGSMRKLYEAAMHVKGQMIADAKRWETLCRMMRFAPGFGWELYQWIKPDGDPDELTPEALKAWLDKEAE